MEINELKSKILEKIKEKKADASGTGSLIDLSILSSRLDAGAAAVSTDDAAERAQGAGTDTDSAKPKSKKTPAGPKAAKFKKPKNYEALEKLFEEYRKKFSGLELENMKLAEEKDRALGSVEALRSKLYSAERELKHRHARIAQLEEAEKALAQLKGEAQERDKRLEEALELHKDLDNMVKNAVTELKDNEAEKKELEEKIGQLRLELEEAAKARHADKVLVQEDIDKLKLEIGGLEKAIEDRDLTIEEDLKSYENLASLINEMNEKRRAYLLKTKQR